MLLAIFSPKAKLQWSRSYSGSEDRNVTESRMAEDEYKQGQKLSTNTMKLEQMKLIDSTITAALADNKGS